MEDLFLILFLLSFVGLVIGLVSPKSVIRWGSKRTRGRVLLTYGGAMLAFFVLFGAAAPAPEQEEPRAIPTPAGREEGERIAARTSTVEQEESEEGGTDPASAPTHRTEESPEFLRWLEEVEAEPEVATKRAKARKRSEGDLRESSISSQARKGDGRKHRAKTDGHTPTKTARKPNCSIIRKWKPGWNPRDGRGVVKFPNGLGLEILLLDDLNDLEEDQLISFVKSFSAGKDPVFISVYASRKAYEEVMHVPDYAKEEGTDWEGGRGYILSYVRNKTGRGAYRGFDEIRWMQEKGKFAHLFWVRVQCGSR